MERQVKLFQVFNQTVFDDLIRIFGQDNVVHFADPSIVGIKYDYSTSKLPKIMDKIPFGQVQQYILTPSSLLKLMLKASVCGFKPTISLDVELEDDEEREMLERAVSQLKKSPSDIGLNCLRDELARLEEDYDAFPNAVTFRVDNERVRIQSNGILLASDKTIDVAKDVLSYH